MTREEILAKHIDVYTHAFCMTVEEFVSKGIDMERFFGKRVVQLQKQFVKDLVRDLTKNNV